MELAEGRDRNGYVGGTGAGGKAGRRGNKPILDSTMITYTVVVCTDSAGVCISSGLLFVPYGAVLKELLIDSPLNTRTLTIRRKSMMS